MGDNWLDVFSEDIKVSVRRGIRLCLLFEGRLVGYDAFPFFFVGFFLWLLVGCLASAGALLCFCPCLSFRLRPLTPLLFPPSSSLLPSSSSSLPVTSPSPFSSSGGPLSLPASRFFLLFPFFPVFSWSGNIPPRRPLAAALASTSCTVSTLVGSAWKCKGRVRFDVNLSTH